MPILPLPSAEHGVTKALAKAAITMAKAYCGAAALEALSCGQDRVRWPCRWRYSRCRWW